MVITLDDIKDMSIQITDKLIEIGLIQDCTDTELNDEFEVQDVIRDILCTRFNIEND
jgi:hypothetical protein